MNDASELINAVKGTKAEITLDCGEFSWTIDGSTVTGDVSDMNLNVNFGTENIPSEKVGEKLESLGFEASETIQISLEHSGKFGFDGTLNCSVDKSLAGKKVVVYYFNEESGEFEVSGVSEVSEDGSISIMYKHASEYLLVMADALPEEAIEAVKSGTATVPKSLSAEKLIKEAEETFADANGTDKNENSANPLTGVVLSSLSGTAVFGAVTFTSRKRNSKKNKHIKQ